MSPSRLQKFLYGIFTVGGGYSWTRFEQWLADQDNGYDEPRHIVKKLSTISSRLSIIHSAAAMASFLVFLVNGRYRTLLDRALRLRLAPPTSQVSREVSFEYLNRQLVWHAFTEFLLFLLPLVGISRWRRWLARVWRKTKALVAVDTEDAEVQKSGELSFLPERTCAICYQDQNSAKSEAELIASSAASGGVIGSAQTDITNPYETIPCGCVYCFVCLASRIQSEEGEGWTCLRCRELVKECKPWNGDVIEEKPRESANSRKVGFSDQPNRSIEESTAQVDDEDLRRCSPEQEASTSEEDVSEGFEEAEQSFDEDLE